MREIRTETRIAAPPTDVWRVLTGFAEYGEWNPYIPRLEGKLVPGERLRVRLSLPGGSEMTIRPTVMRAEEPREFRWLGHLLFPGLFDGAHIFELEEQSGSTRFVQREEFRGVLAGLMLRVVGEKTRRGFDAMNEALRTRVESTARPVG